MHQPEALVRKALALCDGEFQKPLPSPSQIFSSPPQITGKEHLTAPKINNLTQAPMLRHSVTLLSVEAVPQPSHIPQIPDWRVDLDGPAPRWRLGNARHARA